MKMKTPIASPESMANESLPDESVNLPLNEKSRETKLGFFSILVAFPKFDRGNKFYRAGRYDAAVVCYKKAVELKPDWLQAWLKLATSLKKLRRYEEAILACDRAISLDSKNYWAWTLRGVSLFCLQEYEDAIASLDVAISLDEKHYEAWYHRHSSSCREESGVCVERFCEASSS